MKICACIAEYNPLHLGHLKHIEYVKTVLNADKLVVIMSGNFTQRGEPAVLNKYTRAKHAVLAGADVVIELPSVFATANAETFAKGAVNVLRDLRCIDDLCFGVESGTKEDYLTLARAMNDESKEFKKSLKENLDNGYSLAKSKFLALQAANDGLDESLISSPNNILGLEYTKAAISSGACFDLQPMLREGDHNDEVLKKGITSASSIRRYIRAGQIKKLKSNLPKYVYTDLKEYPYAFDKMIMTKLVTASAKELSLVPDCTEGLENRIKALSKDNVTVDALVKKTSTKRYTETRIRRILTSNLLGITADFTQSCLKTGLYAKILAVNSESKNIISAMSEKSAIPLITRKSDVAQLKKTAEKSYMIDELACDLYNLATGENVNPNVMLII